MTSWIVSYPVITLPSVSDKGVEDSTNGKLEDKGGFVEVSEETTESVVTR